MRLQYRWNTIVAGHIYVDCLFYGQILLFISHDQNLLNLNPVWMHYLFK